MPPTSSTINPRKSDAEFHTYYGHREVTDDARRQLWYRIAIIRAAAREVIVFTCAEDGSVYLRVWFNFLMDAPRVTKSGTDFAISRRWTVRNCRS